MSAAAPSPLAPAPARKSFAQVAAAAHKPIISPNKSSTSPVNKKSPALPEGIKVTEEDINEPAAIQTASAPAKSPEDDASRLNVMMKSVTLDDNSGTNFEFVPRKEASDTKSVASRTTFTLDEKESLRPDDSASMQAGGDDDSPNDSVVAGGKAHSNSDARAFRDQLYEIDRTGLAQRQAGTMALAQQRNGGLVFPSPAAAVPPQRTEPAQAPPSTGPPPGLIIPPDEKLQEALASPKDRLFVLKVEQDLIDFIKDSKEQELQLPQTNAFYRMLCHKLAEYYFLGHVVDESLSAVRIFRLPHSRLPPPLIDSEAKPEGSTPPPTNSARKIMRRGAGEPALGPRDSDLEGSTSRPDTGDNSASEDDRDGAGKVKDKSQLTREEREKQYNEVRARIFDGFESKNESENGQDSKGISRTSSASGQRKTKKKRPKDDSFEARSAYSQFHGQSYINNGYFQASSNGAFYPMMPEHPGSQQGFGSSQQGYQEHAYAMGQQWSGQQYPGQFDMSAAQYDPASGGYQGYAASHMANLQSQTTPKPQQPALAGYYQGNYAQSATGMQWMQQQPQQHQQPAYGGYGQQPGYVSDGAQYMMPFGSSQGGFPPMDYSQNLGYGPYAAGQFNPQSQAFVPRGGQNAWGYMAGPGQHAPYGSPRYSNASANISASRSQQSQSQQNSKRSSQTGSNMDSIKQWSTPANLPAKPPPPTSSLNYSTPKFKENTQSLPSHPYASDGGGSSGGGHNQHTQQ